MSKVEAFTFLVIVGAIFFAIGVVFGSIFTGNNAQKEIAKIKEQKDEQRMSEQEKKYEEEEKLRKEKIKQLEQDLANDTERYIVQITMKDGTVHKTEEFEPILDSFYCIQRSRERANNYVFDHQYSQAKLILVGDEYICKADIKSVKLVKVK